MRTSNVSRRAALGLSVCVAVLAGAVDVRAYEATQAEADRIRTGLEDYLGHPAPGAPRVLDVRPKGDGYDLEIDFDALAAPLKAGAALELKLGRSISRLIPLPDGTWRQTLDSFPPMSFTVGTDTTEFHYEGLTTDGVYDPARNIFTSSNLKAARLVGTSTHPKDDKGPRIDVEIAQEGLGFAVVATPAASGGIDITGTQTVAKLTETIRTSESTGDGVPDMNFVIAAGEQKVDVRIAGLRFAEILEIWKFAVAHRGAKDLGADQAALKQRLTALGPVFERFAAEGTTRDIGIETPFGFGGAKMMAVSWDMTGATREGRFDFTTRIEDFKLHSLLLPAWVGRLLPTALELRGHGEGWNFADALSTWLSVVDLANPDAIAPDQTARILTQILPKGTAAVDLDGNRIHAALWDLAIDGHIDTGPAGNKGSLTLKATGLDRVVGQLSEIRTDQNAQTALGGLNGVMALATREGDAWLWRFAFDGATTTLNGQPFGATPEPAPAPEEKPKQKPGKSGDGQKKLQQKL